jgi:hypothetical protein
MFDYFDLKEIEIIEHFTFLLYRNGKMSSWRISPNPVMLATKNFKLEGNVQARRIWPERKAKKKESLRTFGWMQTECVYGIVDKGITVVNGKLVIPEGASEACVDLFDGVHRATVATEMEAEGCADFEIPSFLFAYGTPASIWLPLAFARMELNNFSDGYTTIDLFHVMDIIVTNRINDGLQPPTAEQIQEAIYGRQLGRDSTKSATLQLTQSMLVELYTFYDRLKSTNLLAVVAALASADHSIQAQKCRSLLDSTLDTVFFGGACFLAPLLRPTKGNGAAVPRVGRGSFFPLAMKHKGLFQTGKESTTTFAPFTRGELRELILWAYSKWLLSEGDYPTYND